MPTIAFALSAYLIGSVSFAVLASRLFALPDPRTFGSGNPGATNVLRTGKKAAAALTLLGDAAKGWLAVAIAQIFAPNFGGDQYTVAACVISVALGHAYPLFFRFRGGKGVATALGALLALNILMGLIVLLTWIAATLLWKKSSLSALIAAACAPFYAFYVFGAQVISVSVLGLSLLLVFRHKSNIRKLLTGTEDKIGEVTDIDAG